MQSFGVPVWCSRVEQELRGKVANVSYYIVREETISTSTRERERERERERPSAETFFFIAETRVVCRTTLGGSSRPTPAVEYFHTIDVTCCRPNCRSENGTEQLATAVLAFVPCPSPMKKLVIMEVVRGRSRGEGRES